MPRRGSREPIRRPRVADEIMNGMQALRRMIDDGGSAAGMFTVRTIDVPEPGTWRAGELRELRDALGVSQAVFARLLGVSTILVKSWERGAREPSPLARRLLDTIRIDPSRWLKSVGGMSTGRAA